MRFGIIRPDQKSITSIVKPTLDDAVVEAGLKPMEVDFGLVYRCPRCAHSLSVVVYEFGLLVPAEEDKQSYYALGNRLYVGNTVVFRADHAGETEDLHEKDMTMLVRNCHWLGERDKAELAIQLGKVERPINAVNGVPYWQWNVPR